MRAYLETCNCVERPPVNSKLMTFAGLLVLAFVLVAVCIPTASVELNTRYARGATGAAFGELSKGDTLDHVYHVLGQPLYMNVDPDRAGAGAYKQYRRSSATMDQVARLLADTNMSVSLIYSAPRTRLLHYHLYYVNVSNGAVESLGGPIEMD